MIKAIFPEVETEMVSDGVIFGTQLRKLHLGKWYKHRIRMHSKYYNIEAYKQFIRMVYVNRVFPILDINAKSPIVGDNLYVLDINQDNEKERLQKLAQL